MSQVKRILDTTQNTVVCRRALLADRPLARMRGLLGRADLPAGEGLLLTPAPSIHTAFMRFEIDALFLDRDLRVLRIVESLPPWRAAYARHARSVLELRAGEAARAGVEVDDQLELDEHIEPGDRLDVDDRLDVVEQLVDQLPSGHDGSPDGQAPMKVMVLSSDRRFRELASVLLMRRGCTVTLGKDGRRLTERLERDETEVVVIDAERSLSEAARTAAAIDSLARPVGIVVVNDQAEADLTKFQTVPKWGSFDRLFGAVAKERHRHIRRRSHTRRHGHNGEVS